MCIPELSNDIPRGSRRRRLWELDTHAHCPVIGMCLPLPVLRRLAAKTLPDCLKTQDYDLHCSAVAACRTRSPIAEAVQRDLDRRYQLALARAARCKTTEALTDWWNEALRSHEVAGALWATLTHACCTPMLALQVEGDVHMLQHQAGMAARVDSARFASLVRDHAALERDLAETRQRATAQLHDQAREIESLQSQVLRLRADLIGRDTQIGALRDELAALEAAVPALRPRQQLASECERLNDRQGELQRQLAQAREAAERHQRHAEELAQELQRQAAKRSESEALNIDAPSATTPMTGRAVLCVGGRTGNVSLYRQLVEDTGARFLHHDGGQENNVAKLDASLAAADLVICQAGCVSHGAYWRVKDHCKRTGKQCVFADTPSVAGLKRALTAFA